MRQVLGPGALGRPRGMGWGGRQEEGSGWGTHVNPWLIHVNVWQKPLQYCKVTSLQLIKINEKKKEYLASSHRVRVKRVFGYQANIFDNHIVLVVFIVYVSTGIIFAFLLTWFLKYNSCAICF